MINEGLDFNIMIEILGLNPLEIVKCEVFYDYDTQCNSFVATKASGISVKQRLTDDWVLHHMDTIEKKRLSMTHFPRLFRTWPRYVVNELRRPIDDL